MARFRVQTGSCAIGGYQALLPTLGGAWGRGYPCICALLEGYGVLILLLPRLPIH
jgi:hypothetical protein